MIKKEFIEALKLLSQKLKSINWVIIGSTSLALQGIDIKPGDIDILIKEEDIFVVNERLKEYEIKPIRYRSSKIFRSYLGEFKINNTKVEIIANLEQNIKGKWISYDHRLNNTNTIKINNLEIPTSLLNEQIKRYKESGKSIIRSLKEF